jgi:hypothetical protein
LSLSVGLFTEFSLSTGETAFEYPKSLEFGQQSPVTAGMDCSILTQCSPLAPVVVVLLSLRCRVSDGVHGFESPIALGVPVAASLAAFRARHGAGIPAPDGFNRGRPESRLTPVVMRRSRGRTAATFESRRR